MKSQRSTAIANAQPQSPRETTRTTNGAAAGPVKLVALYGQPADAAAFERYYEETHVPMAQRLPNLKRVETALFRGLAGDVPAAYYRIAELWFADIDQFRTAVASAEGQLLAADVANFASGGVIILTARLDESGLDAEVLTLAQAGDALGTPVP